MDLFFKTQCALALNINEICLDLGAIYLILSFMILWLTFSSYISYIIYQFFNTKFTALDPCKSRGNKMYGGTRTLSSGLKFGNSPQNTIHIYLSKYQNFLVSTIVYNTQQRWMHSALQCALRKSANGVERADISHNTSFWRIIDNLRKITTYILIERGNEGWVREYVTRSECVFICVRSKGTHRRYCMIIDI